MSDSKRSPKDEYQYPGEEYVVESQAAPAAAEEVVDEEAMSKTPAVSVWKRFFTLNKRKVLVIGVVLLALVAFQLAQHKRNEQVAMPAVVPSAPVVVAPSSTSSDDPFLIQKSLADLERDTDSSHQEIANLKNQLATVNDQLQQSNETNDQLKQAMVLLLQELRNLNATVAKQSVVKAHKPQELEVIYVVRALVDGRAWIVGSNGLSQSVTVGDPIPGYGNVTAIQAASGAIMTTSGKVIRLGANDY